jgi:sec-independent protein translocase protein TatA
MFGLGTTEIVVLLVLGLLLFGKNLPGLARTVGKSLIEFKKEVSGIQNDLRP